jgi:hypothetical protein
VVRGHHAERHEQEHTRCPGDAGTPSFQNPSQEPIPQRAQDWIRFEPLRVLRRLGYMSPAPMAGVA